MASPAAAGMACRGGFCSGTAPQLVGRTNPALCDAGLHTAHRAASRQRDQGKGRPVRKQKDLLVAHMHAKHPLSAWLSSKGKTALVSDETIWPFSQRYEVFKFTGVPAP